LIIKDLDTHGKVVKVGWFQESRYPDEKKRRGIPVATAAAINEYGVPSKNIPPRPFMRTTFAERNQAWLALATSGARSIVAGKSTIDTVLNGLGLEAQGDVHKKIASITEPPLSPRTIAARIARKSNKRTVGLLTKPLIDTGLMLSSLSYRVEDE
jgi:hypothetical protein